MAENKDLPYPIGDHDLLIKHEEQIGELEKKVDDLSVLKENVIQLTALEKHLVEDSAVRTEQHDSMMQDNGKQWSSIATLTAKLDQSISAQTDFMKNINNRLGGVEKDLGEVKNKVDVISTRADIKKARISAVATSIAALLAAIAAIIVAFLK